MIFLGRPVLKENEFEYTGFLPACKYHSLDMVEDIFFSNDSAQNGRLSFICSQSVEQGGCEERLFACDPETHEPIFKLPNKQKTAVASNLLMLFLHNFLLIFHLNWVKNKILKIRLSL